FPVHPGDLVILGIGVVVALLGAAHLVALLDERRAARDEERGQQRPHVAPARGVDRRIVGWPFDAAVPRLVVVVPVAVAFSVRLVVLLLVGDEVGEGETVVHGEE